MEVQYHCTRGKREGKRSMGLGLGHEKRRGSSKVEEMALGVFEEEASP